MPLGEYKPMFLNQKLAHGCHANNRTNLRHVSGPTARIWLPYINFGVATTALGFQTAVLYPWHHELDQEFKRLKLEHKTMLQHYHEVKLQRLEELERRVLATEKVRFVFPLPTLFPFNHLKVSNFEALLTGWRC